MSNKQNDIINEDKFEKEHCSLCGIELTEADEWSNMAIKHGNNTICKVCRRNEFKLATNC